MDVNSASNAVNFRNYPPTSSPSSTQGVDHDGDNDGSGSAQSANSQDGTSISINVNVQISNAGQVQHAHHHGHHGPFNADPFMSKLDTSGLSSDQQQTLKDILSKYDGKKMDKSTMQNLVSDLKNAGFDVQKLFDKFQHRDNQQVSGNNPPPPPPLSSGSQAPGGISVLV